MTGRATSFAASFALVMVAGASLYVLAGDDVERARICRPGFAEAGRPSRDAWLKLRQQAFERAGVSFVVHHHDYETDHIVPRCLDGPNTLDNLQLQRCTKWEKLKNGRDGPRCLEGRAYDKDENLEIPTCRAYCAGKLTLEQARGRFKRDP